MAKQAASSGVNIDSLFKEVEGFGGRAASGIDALLQEKKKVQASIEERLGLIDDQINSLNELHKSATGRYYISSPKTSSASGSKGKRRSKEELQQTAAEVVAFIKSAGKEGVSGSDIKAKFGSLLPSVKGWLKLYAPDAKIGTSGERAAMKYTV